MNIDKVLVSIIARGLKAISDEMSLCMEKTTRSPILCEARDFVTGLYDAEGRMLEQTENLPILSFSLSPVCKHIAKKFEGNVFPGDVFFHNDVFSRGICRCGSIRSRSCHSDSYRREYRNDYHEYDRLIWTYYTRSGISTGFCSGDYPRFL